MPAEAVLNRPGYTFLMTNRAVDYQFWLDVGGRGWWERVYQPLTHPYVLSRRLGDRTSVERTEGGGWRAAGVSLGASTRGLAAALVRTRPLTWGLRPPQTPRGYEGKRARSSLAFPSACLAGDRNSGNGRIRADLSKILTGDRVEPEGRSLNSTMIW